MPINIFSLTDPQNNPELDSKTFKKLFGSVLANKLFTFNWNVNIIRTGDEFSITILHPANNSAGTITYNSLRGRDVARTITDAYIKISGTAAINADKTPCAVNIIKSSLDHEPCGIGMNVTHNLLNAYGEDLELDGSVMESVKKECEDSYPPLNVQIGDGQWGDFHWFAGFPLDKRVTYQYWNFRLPEYGSEFVILPESGYMITRTIKMVDGLYRIKVRKEPASVDISGKQVGPARGESVEREFIMKPEYQDVQGNLIKMGMECSIQITY